MGEVRREGPPWVMILMGTDQRNRTTFGMLTSTDSERGQPLPEETIFPPP